MDKIKVLLVDDHQLYCEGMQALSKYSNVIDIYDICQNPIDFLNRLKRGEKPEVVLMDVNMPEMNGIQTTEKALEIHPDLKIIALSMHREDYYVEKMLTAGIKGYVLKNISFQELEKAIQFVYADKNYFSQELFEQIVNMIKFPQKSEDKECPFSDREIEIIKLICQGYTNQEIADKLFISARTVDVHRSNILKKANVRNTAQLVTYAIKNGYFTIDDYNDEILLQVQEKRKKKRDEY
ncbi:MAG: response regulator transcription factor [Bacteroidales bacterium]|nr:response regulator transcription factor [Bacteroidales bacterium]